MVEFDPLQRILFITSVVQTGHGHMRLEGQIAAIVADPVFKDGEYSEPPRKGAQTTVATRDCRERLGQLNTTADTIRVGSVWSRMGRMVVLARMVRSVCSTGNDGTCYPFEVLSLKIPTPTTVP